MRCGEGMAPPGALEGGRVLDPGALSQALRLLLARSDISATRALIAANDAIASFRVLTFPKGTPDPEIDASVRSQLYLGSERMAMRHLELQAGRDERTIFAMVWDRSQVDAIASAARQAGLEPVAVDLKSLCVARAIPVSSCILLDMSADPCEARRSSPAGWSTSPATRWTPCPDRLASTPTSATGPSSPASVW